MRLRGAAATIAARICPKPKVLKGSRKASVQAGITDVASRGLCFANHDTLLFAGTAGNARDGWVWFRKSVERPRDAVILQRALQGPK